ncbi:outer membrane usher protein [Pseudomonas fontis]|uniref:Outer membrane usher protein n=1 Tax=Pseudomonas fontis TaxID=2942633 RepID=A0ABT5NQ67_9PSED|nr:outer membrane usher protein [Pseudomonas fontis]MDD0972844.1 outer membrane usher protein [Pseudomonas fontis]MDD0990301.1 outer membrane usher protein [Pseudomonas fontis]
MTPVISSPLVQVLRCMGLGAFFIFSSANATPATDIQFNTDVLDLVDRENFDLSQFSRKGYVLPGTYSLALNLNTVSMPERVINFYVPADDPKGSEACLTQAVVEQFGLTEKSSLALVWSDDGQCLVVDSLPGLEVRTDLGTSTLYLSIPQAWLQYSDPNWDPPSRWEDGLPGLLFDYNLYGQTQRQAVGDDRNSLSGTGVVGANLGAWRLRADWQARYDNASAGQGVGRQMEWTRYYAYRALPGLGAKLTVGEDFLNSAVFDSLRFTGASLASDDNMLPPNLRGYAPEVTGVARSNARVVISQQDRVLKEVRVASGPFRIQDLHSATSGSLDVRVEEADGSVQEFQVNTANIPYLTRPGQVRYKAAVGRPSGMGQESEGPLFATGEFSWGVSNGWSLYGGAIAGGDYKALNLGLGRDLLSLGALSFDVTQSVARLPGQDSQSGKSYRLSYSKRFESLSNDISLAAYRFSEQGFMTMGEYLSGTQDRDTTGRSKALYTFNSNQQLGDLGVSVGVNYSRQTYWDREGQDRFNLYTSRRFDFAGLRNVNVSLNAARTVNDGIKDDSVYLSVSLPWGGSGTASYSGSYAGKAVSHGVSYFDRRENGDSYRVGTTLGEGKTAFDGSYSHEGSLARVDASASYQTDRYSSASVSLQGGATLTPKGGALHRTGLMGGTRMLVDTDDVAGVPVGGYGQPVYSNAFGKAVVTDVGSYFRSSVRIDVGKLADNAEATDTVMQGTLTEGAIGYRSFRVIQGEKAMAIIRLGDGTHPPFGATVVNAKGQDAGIVTDKGAVYMTGIAPGQAMTVRWGDAEACEAIVPKVLPEGLGSSMALSCMPTLPKL